MLQILSDRFCTGIHQDGKGTESFDTLLEKVEYNRQHEYLTESREKEDVAYLTQLKKEYGLD